MTKNVSDTAPLKYPLALYEKNSGLYFLILSPEQYVQVGMKATYKVIEYIEEEKPTGMYLILLEIMKGDFKGSFIKVSAQEVIMYIHKAKEQIMDIVFNPKEQSKTDSRLSNPKAL